MEWKWADLKFGSDYGTRKEDLDVIVKYLKELNIKRMIELGTSTGLTAEYLTKEGDLDLFITVDVSDVERIGRFIKDDRIIQIKQDAVDFLKSLRKCKFDAIYIDDGHSYHTTLDQIKETCKLGIDLIFIHDLINIDVKRAVDDAIKSGLIEKIEETESAERLGVYRRRR